MKTLQDFKRRVIVGTLMDTTSQRLGKVLNRVITERTENSFALSRPDNGTDSWFDFPKEKELEILDENTVAVQKNGEFILKFKFL